MSKFVTYTTNQFKMKKIIWYSPELAKPKNEQKILFITKDGQEFAGLYIEAEDMYFRGFEDSSSEFHYGWGVDFWRELSDDEFKELKNVWLVNVSLDGENLMYQFPSKTDQMEFVEEIKDRVDNVIYALDPCQLISINKSKKAKNEKCRRKQG